MGGFFLFLDLLELLLVVGFREFYQWSQSSDLLLTDAHDQLLHFVRKAFAFDFARAKRHRFGRQFGGLLCNFRCGGEFRNIGRRLVFFERLLGLAALRFALVERSLRLFQRGFRGSHPIVNLARARLFGRKFVFYAVELNKRVGFAGLRRVGGRRFELLLRGLASAR